ncbi:Autophagy-related protein 13 [Penicillium malachiteum]|uniref:Autophagy-related protein 13 n=1 Tax=Penicillium malachiteum TaxID=1324776 RepID=UPI002548285C|nr:Autophagy-related protein 13 [Penicillium malachiteum]KAJ5721593.1 Autophagy-related protein 13 [Penicillium malachiteum]
MHQNRGPSSVPAPRFPSNPNIPSTLGTVRNDPRDSDSAPPSPTVDLRTYQTRGLGIGPGTSHSGQTRGLAPPREAMVKLSQIVSSYFAKSALIIISSRVDLPLSYRGDDPEPRINRWFNVEIDDTDVLRDPLTIWRTCDLMTDRPPPLIIETYITTEALADNQCLAILDDFGKRWDVRESLANLKGKGSKQSQPKSDEIILERWKMELTPSSGSPSADMGSNLPNVYKKSIVIFRSLFTYSKFLPAYRFSKRNAKMQTSPALQIQYRIVERSRQEPEFDSLTVPLYNGQDDVVDKYNFGVADCPVGRFSAEVLYRTNCDFRVEDSEALLSSRFMGDTEDLFRPSLPRELMPNVGANPEVGSVPVGRRAVEDPDISRAYGSMSTYHHGGPGTGTSPISALRAVRDIGPNSPSPTDSSFNKKLLPPANIGAVGGRTAQLASEGASARSARRPSISFQPFKAPPLSASPALADTPLGVSPRTASAPRGGSTGTSVNSRFMPPPSTAASARRPSSIVAEQAISSSNSASPKPAPISRFSSSFSHRRGRPSSGGVPKIDDDNSSGKASAASSNVQPGSGSLVDATGTSAESIHAEDENIREFLKLLDSQKDLFDRPGSSTHGASSQGPRIINLGPYQRMRASFATLADSMMASTHLQRSSPSSSKQLSGVPPMVAGTSISSASSPGKPISPHTPHTPAIRSRLSSNSVADDIQGELGHRLPRIEPESPLEENPSRETTQRDPATAAAIDIPTSPQPFAPAYRRSSSAAQRGRTTVPDDDEIFTYGIRSVSLGGAYRRESDGGDVDAAQPGAGPALWAEDPSARTARGGPATSTRSREATVLREQTVSVPAAASTSSNVPHLYQPRFSAPGRGSCDGPQSLSSASSSLARGATIPPHLTERDAERDGNASGSNSGISMEMRLASRRPSRHPPPSQYEDDEPLLFAMSDFGGPRRSVEENRLSNHGGGSTGSARRARW